MQMVAESKGYFMHMFPLLNVMDSDDAPIFEHTLSILASSYVSLGGLNGTLGGCGGMQKIAQLNATDGSWKNAAESIIAQDIHMTNTASLLEEIEIARFMASYKPGSELDALIRGEEQLAIVNKGLAAAQQELVDRCTYFDWNRGWLLI